MRRRPATHSSRSPSGTLALLRRTPSKSNQTSLLKQACAINFKQPRLALRTCRRGSASLGPSAGSRRVSFICAEVSSVIPRVPTSSPTSQGLTVFFSARQPFTLPASPTRSHRYPAPSRSRPSSASSHTFARTPTFNSAQASSTTLPITGTRKRPTTWPAIGTTCACSTLTPPRSPAALEPHPTPRPHSMPLVLFRLASISFQYQDYGHERGWWFMSSLSQQSSSWLNLRLTSRYAPEGIVYEADQLAGIPGW
jgi:hypothetical protein